MQYVAIGPPAAVPIDQFATTPISVVVVSPTVHRGLTVVTVDETPLLVSRLTVAQVDKVQVQVQKDGKVNISTEIEPVMTQGTSEWASGRRPN
jgi:molybdopterin biosynthesis enzyme MoaB